MRLRSDVGDGEADLRIVGVTAGALAVVIAILCAGAAVDVLVTPVSAFDPGRELTSGLSMFALASGGILLIAAVVTIELARVRAVGFVAPWAGLALVFGWMAADELLAVHERAESALDTSWQIVFAPVIAVAAVLWLFVLVRVEDRRARALWLGGALFWLMAQWLEAVKGAQLFISGHDVLSGTEEVLEIVGSSLFLLAVLTVATLAGHDSSPPRGREGGPGPDRRQSAPPPPRADGSVEGVMPLVYRGGPVSGPRLNSPDSCASERRV